LHYSKALALSQYLSKERHFVPVETGIKVLNHLGKMYDEHEKYGTFKVSYIVPFNHFRANSNIFQQYFLELIVPLFDRSSNDAKLPVTDILQESVELIVRQKLEQPSQFFQAFAKYFLAFCVPLGSSGLRRPSSCALRAVYARMQ
jgi:hypothetical protein